MSNKVSKLICYRNKFLTGTCTRKGTRISILMFTEIHVCIRIQRDVTQELIVTK